MTKSDVTGAYAKDNKLLVGFFTLPYSVREEISKLDDTEEFVAGYSDGSKRQRATSKKLSLRIISLEDFIARWKDLIVKYELWFDGKYDPTLFFSTNYSLSSLSIGDIQGWSPLHIEWEYNKIHDNKEFNDALKDAREYFNST